MDISKIKTAPYNPRQMTKESRRALKKSIDKFQDISGITINKRTGNVIAGNHRWEELVSTHRKGNMLLTHLSGEYYSIDLKGGRHTGWIVRVVDWDEVTEKAANITANSELISGEFTSGLQDILIELAPLMELDDFEELRMDELTIDMDGIDEDYDWEPESSKTVEAESKKRNKALEDAKGEEPGEVREIISNIKLIVSAELKDELTADIQDLIDGNPLYKEVKIV